MKRQAEEERLRNEVMNSKEKHSKIVQEMVGEEEAPKKEENDTGLGRPPPLRLPRFSAALQRQEQTSTTHTLPNKHQSFF